MEITRQADYAIRAVLELASHHPDERVVSREIAKRQQIPVAFLTKILARLAAEKIVITRRGMHGGVYLARPADEISLLEVIEAIDGPIMGNRCIQRSQEYPPDTYDKLHPIWKSLRTQLRGWLHAIKISHLAYHQIPTIPLSTQEVIKLPISLEEG